MSDLRDGVARRLPASGQMVLAVSGGVDSMVLLDLVTSLVEPGRVHVATFDHGTGAAAAAAATLVARTAENLSVRVTVGRAATDLPPTEAAWRSARWDFIGSVRAGSAAVLTAHTRDDQVETVLFRTMRGAGARGLAGLYAGGEIIRPLLDVAKSDVSAYAVARGLSWVEDPSNRSMSYARNRARLDLLPALRQVRPTLEGELVEVAARAARWRGEVEALVDEGIDFHRYPDAAAIDVGVDSLADHGPSPLAIIWPALVAKVGLAIDRRGIARLAAFTASGRVGAKIQLSGGWIVTRRRTCFEVRRDIVPRESRESYLRVTLPRVSSALSDPRLGGREVKRIVYEPAEIAARVAELGAEITAAYPDGELLVLGLLKGSFIFLGDLVRTITRPLQVDFLAAASYGDALVSSGSVRLLYDPKTNLTGKHVLLVEDIIDSGRTLSRLVDLLQARNPRSLEICALLDKHLATELTQRARFVGFDAPHEFLVGYGLDYAEEFRHIPFIASLQ